METYFHEFAWLLPVIIFLGIWEAVWKLIAMWKAARNDHVAWYVILILINTAGILPIIYILMHRNKLTDQLEDEQLD